MKCQKHNEYCGTCMGNVENICFENDELKLLLLLRDCAVIAEHDEHEKMFNIMITKFTTGEYNMIEISDEIYKMINGGN